MVAISGVLIADLLSPIADRADRRTHRTDGGHGVAVCIRLCESRGMGANPIGPPNLPRRSKRTALSAKQSLRGAVPRGESKFHECQRGGESRRSCKAEDAGNHPCRWLQLPTQPNQQRRRVENRAKRDRRRRSPQMPAVSAEMGPVRFLSWAPASCGLGVIAAHLSYTQEAVEHNHQPVPFPRGVPATVF